MTDKPEVIGSSVALDAHVFTDSVSLGRLIRRSGARLLLHHDLVGKTTA